MMVKLWKNYGSCKVSNYGDVVSIKYKRPIGYLNEDGYSKVGVTFDGKRKDWSVHRLVYFLFGEDYTDALEVNHKDGDKNNNNLSNLEMVTHSQNIQHAWDNKLMYHSPQGRLNIKKAAEIKVRCVETGELFNSLTEAANYYNISKSGISANILGKQK
jgi:hypothetical protein